MTSNFTYFKNDWPLFQNLGESAERLLYVDPNAALVKIRILTEEMTNAIFALEKIYGYENDPQINKLRILERHELIEDELIPLFHKIRKSGNLAAHAGDYGTTDDALKILQFAHLLSCWFMEVYGPLDFQATGFITPKNIQQEDQKEIKQLKKALAALKKENAKQLEQLSTTEILTEDQTKKRRQRSAKYMQKHPLTEDQTRLLIDEQLRTAGFEVDSKRLNYKLHHTLPQKKRKMAIAEWKCGKGYADYVLFDGLSPLAIIEAKAYGKDIAGDLLQAKEYARSISEINTEDFLGMWGDYRVPFIYATNGI